MIAAGARAGRRRLFAAGGIAAAVILLPAVLLAQVDTAWVRRYDGLEHGGDWATSLAVDSTGNVYVAGPSASPGSADHILIKYSPGGETLWTRRQEFTWTGKPAGLAVDRQGNAYLSGTVQGGVALIKYDSAGRQSWMKVRSASSASASALVLDPQGNVTTNGTELRSSLDCFVTKYRSSGDTAWLRYRDWAGYDDEGVALAAGATSEIATTQTGFNGQPGCDYVTSLYDSLGVLRWSTSCSGVADWDTPKAVAIDAHGNVLVTGSSEGTTSSWDYLTIKYSPEGETLWTRRYNGTANGRDEALALAVDSVGNVYVTGRARFSDTDNDFTTFKYRPDGSVAWMARYDGAGRGDGAYGVAAGEGGMVYVTGNSYTAATSNDAATVCYDSLGDTVWTRRYNSPDNRAEYATAIALGPAGVICVAGQGGSASAGSDILVIKYAPQGAVAEPSVSPFSPPARMSVLPSPLPGAVTVSFDLPAAGTVSLRVVDASGRAVRQLCDCLLPAGRQAVTWDGLDDAGRQVGAGNYLALLEAADWRASAKLTLAR